MSTETRTRPAPTTARHRFTDQRAVLLVSGIVYLAAALYFWRNGVIPGDSTSRLANAFYTLYSRDPHLAAVGFVWNPLPSLILLPFLPLQILFPALIQESLLATLMSAGLMTATVGLVHSQLRAMGVGRRSRLVLVAAYALHPMTVLYAGNGMSEACFLLLLLLGTRGMHRWLTTGRTEALVPLGLAIGLAYGARYEALAPVAAVPVVVAAVTWFRTAGTRQRRRQLAVTDAVIAGLPGVLAVLLWAVASKLIVDQWFATFSSEYGNSAQVRNSARFIAEATGDTLAGRTAYWLEQLHGLAPFVLVLLVLALVTAWRRRDPGVLAPITVLGSVLAFDTLALLAGMSFGWLRFQIVAVPGAILLAGYVLAGRDLAIAVPRRPAVAATLVMTLLAVPTTLLILSQQNLSREEREWIIPAGAARKTELTRVDTLVATDLDAMDLPDGAVLTDAATAFAVVLASDHPKQFVITPDRDFPAAVADPAGHRVRYLLLAGEATFDAVTRAIRDPAAPPVRTWYDHYGDLHWTLVAV